MDLIPVALLLSVLCATESYVPHRYYFIDQNKTWTEAQKYCRDHFTDLATINNMEEMNNLKTTLKNKRGTEAWMGLQKTGSGTWSLNNERFYGGENTYSNWTTGQPNSKYFCVMMDTQFATWKTDDCSTQHDFVCYDEKKTDSNRYKLIKENKNWYDAQTFCRENYTDLVTVRNPTENQQIKSLSPTFILVWIGLFNDSWTWSDQSSSSFRNWSQNEPNGVEAQTDYCATVYINNRTWNDEPCVTPLPFICHKNWLVLIQQKLSWTEALNYCRKNHLDLVSVRNKEIQQWVKEVAQSSTTEHVWIGLHHTCTLDLWFWVVGEVVCYQNWAPGNGTGVEDCSDEDRSGAVQSGGGQQWVSLSENLQLNFICSDYEE